MIDGEEKGHKLQCLLTYSILHAKNSKPHGCGVESMAGIHPTSCIWWACVEGYEAVVWSDGL